LLKYRAPEEVGYEKGLTKADIMKAFREEIITESEARDRLADLGYPPQDIDILIKLYQPPPP